MKIHFFTTQPFTVNVQGKSYSLTKWEKILIGIAGIAGLALLCIGSIFTFYGASYLLRKHTFKKMNKAVSTPIDSQIQKKASLQSSNSGVIDQGILNLLKKNIFDITEKLKPIDELQSIEYFAFLHNAPLTLPLRYENIVASKNHTLRKVFDVAIEASLERAFLDNQKHLDLGQRFTWNIIAKDSNGVFHAAIGRELFSGKSNQIIGSELDFYKNVDSKDKDQLKKIILRKIIT